MPLHLPDGTGGTRSVKALNNVLNRNGVRSDALNKLKTAMEVIAVTKVSNLAEAAGDAMGSAFQEICTAIDKKVEQCNANGKTARATGYKNLLTQFKEHMSAEFHIGRDFKFSQDEIDLSDPVETNPLSAGDLGPESPSMSGSQVFVVPGADGQSPVYFATGNDRAFVGSKLLGINPVDGAGRMTRVFLPLGGSFSDNKVDFEDPPQMRTHLPSSARPVSEMIDESMFLPADHAPKPLKNDALESARKHLGVRLDKADGEVKSALQNAIDILESLDASVLPETLSINLETSRDAAISQVKDKEVGTAVLRWSDKQEKIIMTVKSNDGIQHLPLGLDNGEVVVPRRSGKRETIATAFAILKDLKFGSRSTPLSPGLAVLAGGSPVNITGSQPLELQAESAILPHSVQSERSQSSPVPITSTNAPPPVQPRRPLSQEERKEQFVRDTVAAALPRDQEGRHEYHYSAPKPSVASEVDYNRPFNRYANIQGAEMGQVVLTEIETKQGEMVLDQTHSYINANEVTIGDLTILASQAPTRKTVNDHWQMIVQKGVSNIQILTGIVEGGKKKAEQYWPEENQTIEYGNVKVTTTKKEDIPGGHCFTLSVQDGNGDPREVKIFHFLKWPDHGVPESTDEYQAFQSYVNANKVKSDGPELIHCSAGVGRTGVEVARQFALAEVAKRTDITESNAAKILAEIMDSVITEIRKYRGFIQTGKQEIFTYELVADAIADKIFGKSTPKTDRASISEEKD